MPVQITSWDDLWDREAKELCERLPLPLVRSAPVAVLCYQPAKEERLVYLNSVGSTPDPIPLSVGENARKMFFNSSPTAPWRAEEITMTQRSATLYKKTSIDIRKRVYDAELLRYGNNASKLYQQGQYHYKVGLSYKLQSVFPSPLYHEHEYWWRRLPRLGICYTLDDSLGKLEDSRTGLETKDRIGRGATDPLLLICGVAAGNRILAKRLSLLLNGYRRWSKDDPEEEFPGQRIARLLCADGIKPSDIDRWDEAVYIVSRLVIAHHMFFPQIPVALQIFEKLKVEPNSILAASNWPPVSSLPATESDNLEVLVDFLVSDILFLLHALLRWEHPDRAQERSDKGDLRTTLKELIKISLTLLGGMPETLFDEYGTIVPPRGLASLGTFSLPLYERTQLDGRRSIISDSGTNFSRLVKQICPVLDSEEATRDFHRQNTKGPYGSKYAYRAEFRSDGRVEKKSLADREKRNSKWVGEFIRVRFAEGPRSSGRG
jgi:hypothetical protein